MQKNYAIIDGERIELTDEMCRALEREPKLYMNILQQYALHKQLNRLLRRASMIARKSKSQCGVNIATHYYISYNVHYKNDIITKTNRVYFPSEESAQNAIETIILPFMSEHPDFVW